MKEEIIFKFAISEDGEHYDSEINGTPDDLLNAVSVLARVLREELVDTDKLAGHDLKNLLYAIVDKELNIN